MPIPKYENWCIQDLILSQPSLILMKKIFSKGIDSLCVFFMLVIILCSKMFLKLRRGDSYEEVGYALVGSFCDGYFRFAIVNC